MSVATPLPADTQAPTKPTGLVATNTTATGTTISWTASSDNVAVADYLVYRDGTLVGTVTTPSFTDSGLNGDTAHTYTVKARDAAGNASIDSDPLGVRTGVAALGCVVDKKTKPVLTIPGVEPGPWSLLVNGVFYEEVTLPTFEYKKTDSAIGEYVITVKRADGSLAGTVTLSITSSSSGFTCE